MRLKRLGVLLLVVILTLGLCSCGIGRRGKYEKAVEAVQNGRYSEAIESFEALEGYEDSAKYIAYARALQAGDSGDYEAAIDALEALNGFEKSHVYITSYAALASEAEQARIKSSYNQAVANVMSGRYDEAIAAFETVNGYEDSGKYIMYARCLKTGDGGDYETAIKSLTSLGDFKEAGVYILYYTALSYEAEQEYEQAGEVYDEILLFKDVQTRNAALPDKILDRDLAEAERELEEEDSLYGLREMVGKRYTTSETQMYENIMAFAAELHEKQQYEKAAGAYLLVEEDGYEKADAAFKKSAYQYVQELMADEEYSSARYIINEYISGYKDADELSKECSYQLALEKAARGAQGAQAAYNAFKALGNYKDCADRAAVYETKYAEATSKREANEFDAAIALFSELGMYSDSFARLTEARNAKAYAEAVSKRESGEFDAAITLFNELGSYSDSSVRLTEARNAKAYAEAVSKRESGEFDAAIAIFTGLGSYSDSYDQLTETQNAKSYSAAVFLMNSEKYEEAIEAFKALKDYSDSTAQIEVCEAAIPEREYQKAVGLKDVQAAYDAFKALGTYKDSADRVSAYEAKYAEAISQRELGKFDAAIALFSELGTYSDSSARLKESKNAKTYAEAVCKREIGEFDAAIALFSELGTYSDSSARLTEARNAKAYAVAVSLMLDEKYEEAIEVFRALNGYGDSAAQIEAAIVEREYQKAGKLRENGQYAEAYAIYLTIQGCKDVDKILKSDAGIAKVAAYQPGNYVTFGTYPQTKSGTDNTPIEWLVLESDGETALLVSRYALDCQQYNTEYVNTTWEKCTLCSWLNDEFYNRAFSDEEKQSILKSSVSADKNPSYSTNPGNATKGNVFLLSIVEAKKYFTSDKARMCASTDYAVQQGAYVNSNYTVDGRSACWWWLRLPDSLSDHAPRVYFDGSIFGYYGAFVNSIEAVRPCVRVRLF